MYAMSWSLLKLTERNQLGFWLDSDPIAENQKIWLHEYGIGTWVQVNLLAVMVDVLKTNQKITFLLPLTLCLLVSSAENPLQTVWTQIRSDKALGLVWIQTV